MKWLDWLFGRPLPSTDERTERLGIAAGIPTFGLDALSSAAYGPEAALVLLIPLGLAGVQYIVGISGIIIALLLIVYFSYRQTIEAYPGGGGSYTVAGQNLGRGPGLLAAASLMVDYVLDVAVGISAGVGALVSAVPRLHPHILGLCLAILLLLLLVNLRGVREAGVAFMAPTYLFVGCLLVVIVRGIITAVANGGHPTPIVPPPAVQPALQAAGLWILVRAFAGGCTALTGVEAVSNGVTAFREPVCTTARRTLGITVALLAILLAGIAYLDRAYGITATDPTGAGYQSVLSMVTAAVVGRNWFYYVTMASILSILALSANTAFADFPRLCRLLANDQYLPLFFAVRGRRLVYSLGIVALSLLSAFLLIIFGGITDRLIPLFAIGAFLAFTLSQAGMVAHWRKQRTKVGHSVALNMAINGVGAFATGVTVLVVLVAKFAEGAWITVLLIPALIVLMHLVHRHYESVERAIHIRSVHLDRLAPPIAVVPLGHWNRASEGALRFACSITSDVHLLHIHIEGASGNHDAIREQMRAAAHAAGLKTPVLAVVNSPYRFLIGPVLDYVLELERKYPNRKVAVIVPEIIVARWYQVLLHNNYATALQAVLLLKGNKRIVTINVPWYMPHAGGLHPHRKQ